jgi:hypothetical protein
MQSEYTREGSDRPLPTTGSLENLGAARGLHLSDVGGGAVQRALAVLPAQNEKTHETAEV